jgi:uncharacterized protein (UPF0548 family)
LFLFTRPSDNLIQRSLASQPDGFSYADIGATNAIVPRGYTIDRNRVQLGSGGDAFRQAVSAVRNWQMFNLGWVELHPSQAPIAIGSTVAVLVTHFGFWSLNFARVVYVLDDERRFGFAYGTLKEHAERGEERFSVEWNEDDSVYYDILAFSRPALWQAKVAGPLARLLQKRFARDSMTAMKRAVGRY